MKIILQADGTLVPPLEEEYCFEHPNSAIASAAALFDFKNAGRGWATLDNKALPNLIERATKCLLAEYGELKQRFEREFAEYKALPLPTRLWRRLRGTAPIDPKVFITPKRSEILTDYARRAKRYREACLRHMTNPYTKSAARAYESLAAAADGLAWRLVFSADRQREKEKLAKKTDEFWEKELS